MPPIPRNIIQSLYDPRYIGTGFGAAQRQYEIARLADELTTAAKRDARSAVEARLPGGWGPGDVTGRFFSDIGKAGLMMVPSTFMLGAGAGLAARKAVGLPGGSYKPIRQMGSSFVEGIKHDFTTNPLSPEGHPGNLAMDIVGALTLGAGTASRVSAFTRAVKFGEYGAAARAVNPAIPAPRFRNIRGTAKDIKHSPRLSRRDIEVGDIGGPTQAANTLHHTTNYHKALASVGKQDWLPEVVSPGGKGLPPEGTRVYRLPLSNGSQVQLRIQPGKGVRVFRVDKKHVDSHPEGLTEGGTQVRGVPVQSSANAFKVASFAAQLVRRDAELKISGHEHALDTPIEALDAWKIVHRENLKYMDSGKKFADVEAKPSPFVVEGEGAAAGWHDSPHGHHPNVLLDRIEKSMNTRPITAKGIVRKLRREDNIIIDLNEAENLQLAVGHRAAGREAAVVKEGKEFEKGLSAEEALAESEKRKREQIISAEKGKAAREKERIAGLGAVKPERLKEERIPLRVRAVAEDLVNEHAAKGRVPPNNRNLSQRLRAKGLGDHIAKLKEKGIGLSDILHEAHSNPIRREEHVPDEILKQAQKLYKDNPAIKGGKLRSQATQAAHQALESAHSAKGAKGKPPKPFIPSVVSNADFLRIVKETSTAKRVSPAKAKPKAMDEMKLSEVTKLAEEGNVEARAFIGTKLKAAKKNRTDDLPELQEAADLVMAASKRRFQTEQAAVTKKAAKPAKTEGVPKETKAEKATRQRQQVESGGGAPELLKLARTVREAEAQVELHRKPAPGHRAKLAAAKDQLAHVQGEYEAGKRFVEAAKAEKKAAKTETPAAPAPKPAAPKRRDAATEEAPPTKGVTVKTRKPARERTTPTGEKKVSIEEVEIKGLEDIPGLVNLAKEGNAEARNKINSRRNLTKTALAAAEKAGNEERVVDLDVRMDVLDAAKAEVDEAWAAREEAQVAAGVKKPRIARGSTGRTTRDKGTSPRQLAAQGGIKASKSDTPPDITDPPEVKVKKTQPKDKAAGNKKAGELAGDRTSPYKVKPGEEFKKTNKQLRLDKASLRSAGVPEADLPHLAEELRWEFKLAHDEGASGRPVSIGELRQALGAKFAEHFGDEIGNQMFERWATISGGAEVPLGKRLAAGVHAFFRPPPPGTRLHRLETIDVNPKTGRILEKGKPFKGAVRQYTIPVFSENSRSPLVRALSRKYHVMADPAESFLPRWLGRDAAAKRVQAHVERHIDKQQREIFKLVQSLDASKKIPSEAELKRLMDEATRKWHEDGEKNHPMDYMDTANQAVIIGTLFLKPAYLSANLIGQVEMLAVDHAWNPLSMARAARLNNEVMRLRPDLDMQIYGVMMQGVMGSFGWHRGLRGTGKVGKIGQAVGGTYRGFASEGFSLRGTGFKKMEAGLSPKGLISIRYGKGGRVWPGYEKFMDSPWRRNVFFNEARRHGYRTAEDIAKLFDDPEHQGRLLEIARRANKNAIEFGSLSTFERDVLSRIVFFYPWLKASSKWTLRSVTEHPVQTQIRAQNTRYTEKKIRETLGPVPTWMTGTFPVGSVYDKTLGKKVPLVYNPMSVSITSSFGQLAQTAGAIAGGEGAGGSTARLSQFLNPMMSSAIAQITGIDPFTGREIKPTESFKFLGMNITTSAKGGTFISSLLDSVAPIALAQDARRLQRLRQGYGDIESTLMPMTVRERIGRYLGPGFGLLTAGEGRGLGAAAAAGYRVNPTVARSKYFAEQVAARSKYDREILKGQEYVRVWEEAAHKSGALKAGRSLPDELKRAFALRARREGEQASAQNKIGRTLNAKEILAADVGLLINMGVVHPKGGVALVRASLRMPEKDVQAIDRELRDQFLGNEIISSYKAYLNEVLEARSMKKLTVP